jgi:hypothetical protein
VLSQKGGFDSQVPEEALHLQGHDFQAAQKKPYQSPSAHGSGLFSYHKGSLGVCSNSSPFLSARLPVLRTPLDSVHWQTLQQQAEPASEEKTRQKNQ